MVNVLIYLTVFISFCTQVFLSSINSFHMKTGWSGGAMVLLIWIRVGQGPAALAVGAGVGCLDIFSLIYHFLFSFSLSGR